MVEVIAVLIIMGIMSAIAGMGMTSGVEGYILTRNRLDTTQKAQIAMQRMVLELRFPEFDGNGDPIVAVSLDGETITFTSRRDSSVNVIDFSSQDEHLTLNSKLLMDQVEDFEAAYDAGAREITISMTIEGCGEMTTVVYP
jgi:type II secretory pathway pseudopilin PulG